MAMQRDPVAKDDLVEAGEGMSATGPQPPRENAWRRYMLQDINTRNADLLLLLVALNTGVVDAFSIPTLQVFVANMTGNVVFLGIAVAQISDPYINASRSVVALIAFWVGAFVSGQIGHRVGPRRRLWVFGAFFAQATLQLLSAIILYCNAVDIVNPDNKALGLLVPLAFAFGAQSTTARGLNVPEIPTVVITSAMVDLFGDKNIFALHNRPRNRRAAFIFLIFVGAVIGGVALKFVNPALTIVLSAIVKYLAAGFVLLFDEAQVVVKAAAKARP